jgi:hypothetical protein
MVRFLRGATRIPQRRIQGNSVYFFHLKDPLKSAIFLKKIPPQSRKSRTKDTSSADSSFLGAPLWLFFLLLSDDLV